MSVSTTGMSAEQRPNLKDLLWEEGLQLGKRKKANESSIMWREETLMKII